MYGVEFWVVEVPEEPEDPWPEDLAEEEDEGRKVEDIDHADQPVDEHGGPWRRVETVLPVLQRGIKHGLSKQSI